MTGRDTTETATDLIEKLDLLLEEEREALVTGNLDVLTPIAERKGALFDALGEFQTLDAKDLGAVTRKAERNHTLMEQAILGIRSAAKLLADLRRNSTTIDTYDQSGRRRSIKTGRHGSVERRA